VVSWKSTSWTWRTTRCLATSNDEPSLWPVASRSFGNDLRYTLVRLRNNDRSAGARALSDEDTAATIILADEINEGLSGEPDDATPRS
jgi:hypothetical protein